MKQHWTHHKHKWIAAALLCAALVVFAFYYKTTIQPLTGKSTSIYLNDDYTAQTIPLADGVEIVQAFFSDQPILALGIVPKFDGAAPGGSLQLALYDGLTDQLLHTVTGDGAALVNDQYAVFVLPQAVQLGSGVYTIRITASFTGSTAVSLGKSAQALGDAWVLTEADTPADGTLALLQSVRSIGNFAVYFYWAFALVASVLLAGVYLVCQTKLAIHWKYAIAATALGLVFCFVLPPYSAPDEQFHINQAFSMSTTLLHEKHRPIRWSENYKRADDTNPILEDELTTVYSYQTMVDNLLTTCKDDTRTKMEGEQVGGYRLLYWPSVLALSLGRLLGLGFVQVLLLGRLANLLCLVGLTTLAIRLTPIGKDVFAALGLLPMTLHLAASFSRDALTMALYFFYTALILYYSLQKPRLDWPQYLAIAATALVAGPAKLVYAPIIALCVLLPKEKFYLLGKPLKTAFSWLFKALVIVVACWSFASSAWGQVGATLPKAVQQPETVQAQPAADAAPQAAAQAPAEAAPAPTDPDSVVYTAGYILTHPKQTLVLAANTFFTNSTFYLESMLGGWLGYYNLEINRIFVYAFLVLLVLAALPQHRPQPLLAPIGCGIGLALSVAACALVVAGCLTWTPTYYTTIYGIQGRYFLPAMPLLLVCVSRCIKGFAKQRPMGSSLIVVATALNLGVLANVLQLVYSR